MVKENMNTLEALKSIKNLMIDVNEDPKIHIETDVRDIFAFNRVVGSWLDQFSNEKLSVEEEIIWAEMQVSFMDELPEKLKLLHGNLS